MVDYSHIIVGGGVVGLAVGSRLARAGGRVLLLERNGKLGEETSSRNSEVIHAGLYYQPNSLKMQLCLRGKELIYEAHRKHQLPDIKQCGKWLIAQTAAEREYLEKLKKMADDLTGVPLNWLPLDKCRKLEPAVRAQEAVLESPTTGIMSSHTLMDLLESQIQNSSGDIVTHANVKALRREGSSYAVDVESGGEEITLKSDSVINAAGLHAPKVSNMLLPDLNLKSYYAKGSYFSYPLSHPKVERLIYPVPTDQGSLGTHLTIDLAGRLRFGPDFEWVDSPTDLAPSSYNLKAASVAIGKYIDIDSSALVPDYAGIRPKLSQDMSKFHDFVIREDLPGFVNLLGIDSPGLTSSMAIGEYVHDKFF